MRCKKGDARLLVVTVTMLVLAVWIGATMAIQAREAKDPTRYQKDFLTKDIATLLDLLYGIHNNFFFNYTSSLWNFSDYTYDYASKIGKVDIGGQSVIISDKTSKRYYKYMPDETAGGRIESASPETIRGRKYMLFKRTGTKIEGGVDVGFMESDKIKLNCEETTETFNKIILDPGHGTNAEDTGHASSGIIEEERTQRVADYIAEYAAKSEKLKGKKIILTRQRTKGLPSGTKAYKTIKERIELIEQEKPDLILSLHMSDRKDGKNILKAYVPYVINHEDTYLKRKKIACKILNTIIRGNKEKYIDPIQDIDGAAIIPVELDYLDENDPMQVLSPEIPSVLLELGSVHSGGALSTRNVNLVAIIAESLGGK